MVGPLAVRALADVPAGRDVDAVVGGQISDAPVVVGFGASGQARPGALVAPDAPALLALIARTGSS